MEKKELKTIWIDCETTGTDNKNDRIIELAAICGDDVFHCYCLPEKKPENWDFITKLTGITWEFLEEKGVSDRELYLAFEGWLSKHVEKFDKTDKATFCGYGARFDFGFCYSLFERNGNNFFGSFFISLPEDVQSFVARAVRKGKIPMLANYQLSTVCEYFGIKFGAHSAIEDIRATIALDHIVSLLK